MKVQLIKKGTIFILIIFFIMLNFSDGVAEQKVGEVAKARGRVSIVRKDTFRGIFWKKDPRLFIGDIVRTKRKSFATVNFIDGSRVELGESSRLIIEKYIPGKEVELENPSGRVIYSVKGRVAGLFRVKTPTALIGVKGTEFATITTPTRVAVFVKKGVVEVFNPRIPFIKVKVPAKHMTIVALKTPPLPPRPVKTDVIQKVFKVTGLGKPSFKKAGEEIKKMGKEEEEKEEEEKKVVKKETLSKFFEKQPEEETEFKEMEKLTEETPAEGEITSETTKEVVQEVSTEITEEKEEENLLSQEIMEHGYGNVNVQLELPEEILFVTSEVSQEITLNLDVPEIDFTTQNVQSLEINLELKEVNLKNK